MIQNGIIEAENVSEAWIRYVDTVKPHGSVFHAALRIRNPIVESSAGRDAVEAFLADWSARDKKVYPVRTVRTTIFPLHYARRTANAAALAEEYRKDYQRIRNAHPANKYGTYFGRMVDTQVSSNGAHYDQLNDTIAKLRRKSNATMMEMDLRFEMEDDAPALTVYETERNHARSMGFPCMSHLSFQRDGELVHVVAFYRNQDVGRKAYGNILGLGQLCEYIAAQAGLRHGSLTLVAGRAYIDAPKMLLAKHLPLIRNAAI